MKCKCEGCYWEFCEALYMQKKGLHLATWVGGYSYPDNEHFGLYMVNDDGEWQAG